MISDKIKSENFSYFLMSNIFKINTIEKKIGQTLIKTKFTRFMT